MMLALSRRTIMGKRGVNSPNGKRQTRVNAHSSPHREKPNLILAVSDMKAEGRLGSRGSFEEWLVAVPDQKPDEEDQL